jgi:hypothetical protein
LRAIAERGYGGAASTDQDQRAQAISLFIQIGQLTACDDCNAVSAATPSPMQRRFG